MITDAQSAEVTYVTTVMNSESINGDHNVRAIHDQLWNMNILASSQTTHPWTELTTPTL